MIKIFDFETCKKIGSQLPAGEYFEWIDFALKNKDKFVMPAKTRINQADGDYYACMPCMYEEENLVCNKMIVIICSILRHIGILNIPFGLLLSHICKK